MKLTLERKDIISLIGKALGKTISEKQVEVNAEPFEVIIYDAEEVLAGGSPENPPSPPSAIPPPTPAPKPKGTIVIDDGDSLEDLHAHSAAIASQQPATSGKGKKKIRQLMPGESAEPRNPLEGEDVDG